MAPPWGSSTSSPAARTSCCSDPQAPGRRTLRSRLGSAPASPGTALPPRRRPSGWRSSRRRSARAAPTRNSTGCSACRCRSATRSAISPSTPARRTHVHAHLARLRAGSAHYHQQQTVQRVGRDLRRRGHRHRDDRPARAPRRAPLPQRRQLPPQEQGPRPAPRPRRMSRPRRAPLRLALRAHHRGARRDPPGRSLLDRRQRVRFRPALTARGESGGFGMVTDGDGEDGKSGA